MGLTFEPAEEWAAASRQGSLSSNHIRSFFHVSIHIRLIVHVALRCVFAFAARPITGRLFTGGTRVGLDVTRARERGVVE